MDDCFSAGTLTEEANPGTSLASLWSRRRDAGSLCGPELGALRPSDSANSLPWIDDGCAGKTLTPTEDASSSLSSGGGALRGPELGTLSTSEAANSLPWTDAPPSPTEASLWSSRESSLLSGPELGSLAKTLPRSVVVSIEETASSGTESTKDVGPLLGSLD